MRFFASVLAALAVTVLSAADKQVRSARVDFTSQPEGADVILDGNLRGVTPIALTDVAPGQHRVRFELKNHEPDDQFFVVDSGSFSTMHSVLSPMRGLLLVTTEPSGCDITIDGISLGHTPKLVASLDASQTHKMLLQKPGYQSRTVEVKFSGRTPIVRHEKLLLDSGTLNISTDPVGADVTVNGIPRGKTPVKVSDIPKGRSSVSIVMNGYESEVREITLNPGDTQNLFVALKAKPGTLWLSSVPAGARFYVNGQARGKGPLAINSLAPGTYLVRAELEGHGTLERNITIGYGQTLSEEFRLENVVGRLEVKSYPIGAQVLVDGHIVGVTKSDDPNADFSDILSVEGLTSGEHTVTFRKDGYAEVVRHPVVEPSKTVQVSSGRMKRIFKPNVEIVTESGSYRGVLVENTPETIVIEVQMGIARSFPRASVLKFNFLTD